MYARFVGWLLGLGLAATACGGETIYPCRWVYISNNLGKDQDVERMAAIMRTAAEHELNGVAWAGGLDHRLDKRRPDWFGRLAKIKTLAAELKLELIPLVFSVGYAGAILAEDRNLAEGLPVRDARLLVKGNEARPASDAPAEIVGGNFEEFTKNRVKGSRFHDQPGEISFIDTSVFHGGRAALRFENFGRDPHGHGRVSFEVPIRPHRCYRLSCWVKTEGLEPVRGFMLQVLAGKRTLAPFEPKIEPTADWRQVTLGFNSLEFDKVNVYAGVWGGKSGRFWVDDLRIEEVALANILRRPGTPLTVRDDASDTVYEEGRDFAPLADPKLTFRFDHDGPPLRLLPGGRIRDGQALRVSYYHGMAINDGQVTACMSEPKLYDIWQRNAEAIQKLLHPRTWLLSMDEIRAGGSCAACQARKMTMGEILGDCITRQFQIIRRQDPQARVFIWSDMLDPRHNAHGDYYLVQGDFTGSWLHVPKELEIVCWWHKMRRESLDHFSGLGFKTLAGAYYDVDTLDSSREWLAAIDRTPGAVGIMYTTWRNKYELLAPFGDMVMRRGK